MIASDFKVGVCFKKNSNYFKLVENGITGNPNMIVIQRGEYFEFYGNLDKVEKGVAHVYYISPLGDSVVREQVTLENLTKVA